MARQSEVKEGQIYADLPRGRHGSRLWKVKGLYENATRVPHARLIDVEDPLGTKTISCYALTSRTYYELVSDTNADSS